MRFLDKHGKFPNVSLAKAFDNIPVLRDLPPIAKEDNRFA